MSTPSRRQVLWDSTSFILGWGLLLHQAWIFQHGGKVSEWLIIVGAAIVGVPGVQHGVALRMGVPPSPTDTPPSGSPSPPSSPSSSGS